MDDEMLVTLKVSDLRQLIREEVSRLVTATQPPPMLTCEEVAQRLGLCSRTVLRLIHDSDLPAKRMGRQWRVRLDDLEAWERDRDAA